MQPGSATGRPVTRFVETVKGFVGYQVYGEPERDIVFITNWMTNVDLYWDELGPWRLFEVRSSQP